MRWMIRRAWERFKCRLFGHEFYQCIGGHDSEGLPYPAKRCFRCDYQEDC